jgi:hypothetical protein
MDLKKFAQGLTPEQFDVAIEIATRAEKMGINPMFVLPMIKGESTFNHNAIGPVTPSGERAVGVMQLMPSTAKSLGVDPSDPDQNIDGGLRLIKQLMENKKIGSDPYKIIAAYNGNPKALFLQTGDIRDILPETRNHMIRVSDYYGGDLPSASFTPLEKKESAPEVEPAKNETDAETQRLLAKAKEINPIYDENQPSVLGAGMLGAGLGTSLGGTYATAKTGLQALGNLTRRIAPTSPQQVLSAISQPSLTQEIVDANGLVPTEEQHARAFQGNKKETGITGRASQTTYNLRTQQIAEEARKNKQIMEDLKKLGIITGEMKPLSQMGGLASTPSGVVGPINAVENLAQTTASQEIVPQVASKSPLSWASKLMTLPVKGALGGFALGAGAQDVYNRANMGAPGEAVASGLGTTASLLSPYVSGLAGGTLGVVGGAVPLYLAAKDRTRELMAHPERHKEVEKDRGYYVDPMGGSVYVGN